MTSNACITVGTCYQYDNQVKKKRKRVKRPSHNKKKIKIKIITCQEGQSHVLVKYTVNGKVKKERDLRSYGVQSNSRKCKCVTKLQ